jgi:hypothetical protein
VRAGGRAPLDRKYWERLLKRQITDREFGVALHAALQPKNNPSAWARGLPQRKSGRAGPDRHFDPGSGPRLSFGEAADTHGMFELRMRFPDASEAELRLAFSWPLEILARLTLSLCKMTRLPMLLVGALRSRSIPAPRTGRTNSSSELALGLSAVRLTH